MGLLTNKEKMQAEDIGYSFGDNDEPKKDGHKFQEFKDQNNFLEACAQIVKNACNKRKENIHIALSGGSLQKLYIFLAKNCPEIFENVIFWEVDERYVDQDDDESNYKLIKENLLEKIGNNSYKDFIYFDIEKIETENSQKDKHIEEIIKKYEIQIGNHDDTLSDQERLFDLVILGLGEDGHTASLFPNGPELDEDENLVLYTKTENHEVKDRFTLTFPAILDSESILVFLKDLTKKNIYQKLKLNELDSKDFPAIRLLDHENINIYFGNF